MPFSAQLTHPAEARLRLVLSQEFLRTRLEEEEGGSGEDLSVLRADEGDWRLLLSKSAISLQNGQTLRYTHTRRRRRRHNRKCHKIQGRSDGHKDYRVQKSNLKRSEQILIGVYCDTRLRSKY